MSASACSCAPSFQAAINDQCDVTWENIVKHRNKNKHMGSHVPFVSAFSRCDIFYSVWKDWNTTGTEVSVSRMLVILTEGQIRKPNQRGGGGPKKHDAVQL